MPPPFEQLDSRAYALPPEVSARLFSPALVVYLDRVRDNLAAMLGHLGGRPERWRPHVKTTKIPAVWRELARAGVRHFKCATVREAEHLLDALVAEGVRDGDVMLAHPLIGPELQRLGELRRQHPGAALSVLCEDPQAVPSVPAGLGIHVDVNPGMNRTGVPLARPDTIAAVARAAGERFGGVHYYDGHLHAGGPEQRRREVFACYDALMDLLGRLARAGLAVPEVTTSGTPTFLQALQYRPLTELAHGVHRVSPGTVVFHDARSEEESEGLGLLPAALVFARVVSHPTDDIVTCDAGSKSIAAEAGDPCAVALGRPGLEALAPSEEHLPLRVTSGAPPPRGTELLLIPRHVCPTVNLAEEALLVEGGAVRGTVPVAARAHALGLA